MIVKTTTTTIIIIIMNKICTMDVFYRALSVSKLFLTLVWALGRLLSTQNWLHSELFTNTKVFKPEKTFRIKFRWALTDLPVYGSKLNVSFFVRCEVLQKIWKTTRPVIPWKTGLIVFRNFIKHRNNIWHQKKISI